MSHNANMVQRPSCSNFPKTFINDVPKIENVTDGSDDDTDEFLGDGLEDSCRLSLSKKMPSNGYLTFDKQTKEIRRKSYNACASK